MKLAELLTMRYARSLAASQSTSSSWPSASNLVMALLSFWRYAWHRSRERSQSLRIVLCVLWGHSKRLPRIRSSAWMWSYARRRTMLLGAGDSSGISASKAVMHLRLLGEIYMNDLRCHARLTVLKMMKDLITALRSELRMPLRIVDFWGCLPRRILSRVPLHAERQAAW